MNEPTRPYDTSDPSSGQNITAFQVQMQTFHKTLELLEETRAVRESLQVLSGTLAAHVKQNIDTFSSMQEYISEQMAYRLFRQGMEENNLALELKKKELELEFMEKKYHALESEHQNDTVETESLRYEYARQKLEIENMQKNIEILKGAKHSTNERMKSVKAAAVTPDPFEKKMKETFILTIIGASTAAGVGAVIAFLVFLVRLYIQNSP